MVLVGTDETCILKGTIHEVKCPNCNLQSKIDYIISTKYTTLTSIPLFPVGNTVNIECNSCSTEIDFDELDESSKIKLIEENRKTNRRRPIWLFSGVILLIGFIFYYCIDLYQTGNETKILVKNPTFGDVYSIKFSNGYYSTMRIDKITNDSVYLTRNDYDVYLSSDVEDIDKTENYTNKKINYSKKDLLKLYDTDEIVSIIRK